MNHFLRYIWFVFIVRPLIMFGIGLNIRHRERLTLKPPFIIVANHNSHLDTMVLASLFPWKTLKKFRPVAAMDYFMRNGALAWFATKIIGIIPIERGSRSSGEDPLKGCTEALDRGEILLLFPEGTRGEPEQMASFKKGIAHLARRHPHIPVIPVFMHGLGKSLPRGEFVLVPFICDVVIGEPMEAADNNKLFMEQLSEKIKSMKSEINLSPWE